MPTNAQASQRRKVEEGGRFILWVSFFDLRLQITWLLIFDALRVSKDIINQKPEFRILAFLNAHKKGNGDHKELVPITRQEIANFTGLRVETVIRAFAKMKAANKIEINNHKIYF